MSYESETLKGEKREIGKGDALYPESLLDLEVVPETLYVIGNAEVLNQTSVAVIGSRKCTPYGSGCASRFAEIAARAGAVIVTGGALGIETAAIEAALAAGGRCVVVLPSADVVYPTENAELFQRVIDRGGAVVGERPWGAKLTPWVFRARCRIVAALARGVLVTECTAPSGRFTTAEEAMAQGRDVLAVPGAITSAMSAGPNALIAGGARPIVDDASFEDYLAGIGLTFPPSRRGRTA